MALIGNYTVFSKHPGRDIGGGATGLGYSPTQFNKASMARGVFTNAAWSGKSGKPDGYRPPYAWVLPIKDGALSSRNYIFGTGNIGALNLAGGLNGEGPLTGAGDITNAPMQLIAGVVAALSGSGAITADIKALINLAASLAGAGDLAGAAGALAGALAELSGTGTVAGTFGTID